MIRKTCRSMVALFVLALPVILGPACVGAEVAADPGTLHVVKLPREVSADGVSSIATAHQLDILELVQSQGGSVERRRTEVEPRKSLDLGGEDLRRLVQSLEEEMHEAAKELRFEYAARLRDEVNELKRELRDLSAAQG